MKMSEVLFQKVSQPHSYWSYLHNCRKYTESFRTVERNMNDSRKLSNGKKMNLRWSAYFLLNDKDKNV